MKPRPEQDRLLKDILHEEGYAEFRRALGQQSLAELRRHRRSRRTRQLLALAACVVLGLGLSWVSFTRLQTTGKSLAKRTTPAGSSAARSPVIPRQTQIAAKRPLFEVVATRADTVSRIADLAPIEVIRTKPAGAALVSQLSDDELLAEFAGRPAALVAASKGTKRLLLLDAVGGNSFFHDESSQPSERPR